MPWTLNVLTFSDGGSASGSFIYDAAINRYAHPSITVTPFTVAGLLSYAYAPASMGLDASAAGVDLLGPDSCRFLRLRFSSPLAVRCAAVARRGALLGA